MAVEFSAHNIRLDDGTLTKPDANQIIEEHPWYLAARRILETVFPGDKTKIRIADLGCLEGGYSVELARLGFQVLGVEVRESNFAACNYVKSKTALPNLSFVKDDVWNIANYGTFDAMFCCGLLYHLDRPKAFLETLSKITKKLVILQTHFSTSDAASDALESDRFNLSPLCDNEGIKGRWYAEFPDDDSFKNREAAKWTSWDNRKSFWVQREYLLQAIQTVGFDLVMEQYDGLGSSIAENMLHGYYKSDRRGTFIGIKT